MKTRRYSDTQVFRILQEVDSGVPVVNAAREHGVSAATIHRWKSKYGGMIGVAAQAGKPWAIVTALTFLIMAMLAFTQRSMTGL